MDWLGDDCHNLVKNYGGLDHSVGTGGKKLNCRFIEFRMGKV